MGGREGRSLTLRLAIHPGQDPMSNPNLPTEAGSSFPTQVDPQRLSLLVEQAITLKSRGDASFVSNVLKQLNEAEREEYLRPLLERLREMAAHSQRTSHATSVSDTGSLAPAQSDDSARAPNDHFETVDSGDGATAPTRDLPLPESASSRPARRAAEQPSQSLPKSIGKFQIKRELGRGAFGAVYLGYDEELERHVAVKVSHLTDAKQQEQLRIEASKLAQIESPGIVPVYHIGRTESDELYIVEKFIQGTNLRRFLRPGPLSPAAAVTLMRDIALGMEPAHLRDILHRDLKPENILIEDNGRPWIADFGLAISEQEQQQQKRQLAGTPPYMSPEQIKGKVDFLDPRSDIWALGVIFYEMLCGKLPFSGSDRQSLVEQICDRDPRPLQQRAPGHLTEEMDQIFRRCCAKQPAGRYATVRQLAEDLEALIASGLSDRNIQGDTMVSRASETGVTAHSFYQSTRRTVSTRTQHSEETRSEPEPPRRSLPAVAYRVLAVLSVIGLSIAGSIGYQIYSKDASDNAPLASPGLNSAQPTVVLQDGGPGPPAISAVAPAQDPNTAPPRSQPGSDNSLGLQTADGSRSKPWVVAQDGSGSHRTIAAAVAAGPPGAFIEVMPGIYNEAISITQPVTIDGRGIERLDEQAAETCEIHHAAQTPLTIDCPSGNVILRNISIQGQGHPTDQEFNAVDLIAGSLELQFSQIKSHSHNCIKVRNNARLILRDCDFVSSRQFAVSAAPGLVQARECKFRSSGIQLVGGSGSIEDCSFYGEQGIYVSDSVGPVLVNGCTMDGNLDFGIASANGGDVVATNLAVHRSKTAIRASYVNDGKTQRSPGKVTLRNRSTLQDCETGILVQGGAFESLDNCRIERCDYGVWVDTGTIKLSDLTIAEADRVAINVAEMAKLELRQCTIERSETGLLLVAGELLFSGGTIRDCQIAGIVFGAKDKWPKASARGELDRVAIQGTKSAGIMAYSGPVKLQGVRFQEGVFGLWAEGPDVARPSRQPLIEVIAVDTKFINQSKKSVVAVGDSRITLDADEYAALADTGQHQAIPPAIIRQAPLETEAPDKVPVKTPPSTASDSPFQKK
jgi:serine/threonine protein kinase